MSSSSRVFRKIRKGSKSAQFIEGIIRDANHGESKRFSTIGSMKSSGIKLSRACNACGHKSMVDYEIEINLHGEDSPLTEISKICEGCGANSASVMPG